MSASLNGLILLHLKESTFHRKMACILLHKLNTRNQGHSLDLARVDFEAQETSLGFIQLSIAPLSLLFDFCYL